VTGRPIFLFVVEHLPPARGFREPQKAVALLVFAYAFLGAAAVEDLVAGGRSRPRRIALTMLLAALPLVYGYRGLWGRMATSSYPVSWAEADRLLARESHGTRTLFLPWHGYTALSFAHHRVVGNPSTSYFHSRVLASRDVGEGVAAADNADPVDAYVSALLARGPRLPRLGACLAPIGIRHLLVAK
jgi:hypothetical protein